jgi:hypothetical protein
MLKEIINFMFTSFFHFFGIFLILLLISSIIIHIFDSLVKIFHKNINNFYISEKSVDEDFLEELKKYVSKKRK